MRLGMYSAILSAALVFSACAPKHSEIVVADYQGGKITMGEFEKAYSKTAGGSDAAKDDSLSQYKNFLDLFVTYKLKLEDAYKKGLDKDPELNKELTDYKKQVGENFLTENDLIMPAIKKLYDRRKYEYRVSHLMVLADTISFDKAKSIADGFIDSVKQGKNFEELVAKYSADKSTKNKGGDIYYLTSGEVFPQFEEIIYNTEPGTVSSTPVKSNYGYHVIKVTEKRKRVPAIKASHILIRFSAPDTTESYNKALEVLQKAKSGEDFTELAKQYSEDEGSKTRGGDLGFFERRRMIPAFDEAAFNLNVGEISGIVKTNYGYHIIKVTDKKEYPSFEDDKEELTQLYKKTNYNTDYRNYMDSLRTVYGYKLNDSVFAKVAAFVEKDTLLMNSSYWESKLHNELKDSVLYVFNNAPVTVDSFFAPLVADKKNSAKRVNKALITTNIAPKIERSIIDAEAMKLEQRDPDFKDLMTDYKNGIYVFKLQEDEVWNKIDVDSSKVFDYFTQHQGDFTWGERVNFSEIFSKSDSLINAYYAELQNGADFDSLAARHTERMGFRVKKGEHGLTETGDSELAETAAKLNAPGDYSKPFKFENGYSIVKLIEKKPAGAKTFEEAKAEAMSSYQEKESARLEKEYVDGLKQTYKPEIHYEKLEEAFKPQE